MDIRVLDNLTINKIAAGEVIENPASVVKELVENSIDAGAKNITVEISEGGLKSIKVSDDGSGITKNNISIAFLEHATSKLKKIEDLDSIFSYGFRGEALPSIASISDVEIITKNKEDNNTFGYRYLIGTNYNSEIEEIASNYGTVITVKDLFKNVPVRKKFLKDISKESSYVYDLITKFAMSNPNLSFTYIVDGRQKFKTNGNGDLKSVLYIIYGKEIYDSLIDIDDVINDIHVTGAIAKPIVARNTKADMIYFVNGRYIKNKVIVSAIETAYDEYLMQHKYPLVVLNIAMDSRELDVNVHPKKLEVRFKDDEKVYVTINEALSKALRNSNLIHEEKLVLDDINNDINNESYNLNIDENDSIKNFDLNELPSLSSILKKPIDEGLNYEAFTNVLKAKESAINNNASLRMVERPFIEKTLSEDHKYIGQIFDTYILVEFDSKLYIIDQHAAHEKINYEKLMKMYKDSKPESQSIFPSIVIRLTPKQFAVVEKNISEFKKLGYEIEIFGDMDIKIDAVPYNIININNKELLMDIIESLTDDKHKEEYDSIADKIASISCKKAVKANHHLTEIEVKELLRNLFKLENPYNCPHGRPTIISLSKTEFEKKFGRIV